ncbi:hypothetical protein QBC35DRAFT_511444 [Podospora australis]|uniref:Eisosome protein 1 n=1 Tax=Podospora australis TaxID=1536484 RepID=A0AAN6X3L0_9PEZI|nr:hypothetical protein QBC35DRAFT_511444 [Podospora australis]
MGSASLTAHGAAHRSIAPNNTGRLKYANAEDLPSYPSAGLREGDAAASAAATLGWANQKSVEHPKAEINTNTASTAALLAAGGKSPKVSPEIRPISAVGPQAALAAASVQRTQKQQPSPTSTWGSSAANLAFSANRAPLLSPPPPPLAPETSSLNRQNSLRAAKGAMSGGTRPRAQSSPQTIKETYPDQANAAANALSAATSAHHRPTASVGSAGAMPFTTMDRRMFTSNPPVKPEVDEQKRADVLHASAVAMAKRMYTQQQKMIDNTTRAHTRSSSFPRNDPTRPLSPVSDEPLPYGVGLQEAAYRLAQERLAKLQEEHDRNKGMGEYYGTQGAPQRNKLGSIRGKLTRRRSSSDGDLLEDQRRSQHIRKQMSMLNNKLTEVDEEKRTHDRQALLAAAQRNVKAQLHDMDERLQAENGGIPQSAMGDWDRKAQVAAQTRFDSMNYERQNKIDLGGGKFMDRSEIDAIAAKKVQPLLDEINERAEREKERKEMERLEEERRRGEAERDRLREKEIQDIHKQLKDQQKEDEKARKAEIKQEEKLRKEEERARKAEQKRASRDGKQKENENAVAPPPASEGTVTEITTLPPPQETETKKEVGNGHLRNLSIGFPKRRQKSKDEVTPPEKSPKSEGETGPSPSHKVRDWLLSRLPRPRAKSSSAAEGAGQNGAAENKGFVGGATLARLRGRSSSPSPKEIGKENPASSAGASMRMSSSMHDVAMAGRPNFDSGGEEMVGDSNQVSPYTPPRPLSQASIPVSVAHSVSTITTDESGDHFVEARSTLASPLTPPKPIAGGAFLGVGGVGGLAVPTGRVSPFRESRFSENLE